MISWYTAMMVLGIGLVTGFLFGFVICAIMGAERIAEAKTDLAHAQDYIKLLRGQQEQN